MAFNIGVISFDWGHNSGGASYGDQTVYQVEIISPSLAEANAVKWQLLGYKGRTVGVTWTDDPMIDGLYVLTDVSVAPIENYLATGRMMANVVLERQPDLVEASYRLSYRTDLTPTNYRVAAVHGTWTDSTDDPVHISDNDSFVMADELDVAGPGDLPAIVRTGSKAVSGFDVVSVQQGCIPSQFELGACRIEVNGGDEAGWWVLTGDKVPEGHDVRISNGAIRLTVVDGEYYVLTEHWGTDDVWVQAARYHMGVSTSGYQGGFVRRFRILRNDRAQVVVTCPLVRADNRNIDVTFTLSRGQEVVQAVMSAGFEGSSAAWAVKMLEWDGTNMATTVVSSGLNRTAAISGGVTPSLYADTTGVTLSATTDDALKTSSAYHLVGMGAFIDGFRTEVQVSDRAVY